MFLDFCLWPSQSQRVYLYIFPLYELWGCVWKLNYTTCDMLHQDLRIHMVLIDFFKESFIESFYNFFTLQRQHWQLMFLVLIRSPCPHQHGFWPQQVDSVFSAKRLPRLQESDGFSITGFLPSWMDDIMGLDNHRITKRHCVTTRQNDAKWCLETEMQQVASVCLWLFSISFIQGVASM